jgi:hypothetical protein
MQIIAQNVNILGAEYRKVKCYLMILLLIHLILLNPGGHLFNTRAVRYLTFFTFILYF